jgi:hypothetical protein
VHVFSHLCANVREARPSRILPHAMVALWFPIWGGLGDDRVLLALVFTSFLFDLRLIPFLLLAQGSVYNNPADGLFSHPYRRTDFRRKYYPALTSEPKYTWLRGLAHLCLTPCLQIVGPN